MGQNEELDQQLWEFVYELLPEQEADAIRERITSEPDVARAYARTRLKAELVAEAAQFRAAPIPLPSPADRLHDKGSPAVSVPSRVPFSPAARAANWCVGLATAALVCLIGYGVWNSARLPGAGQSSAMGPVVCTNLSVPDRVRDDVTNLFSVRTTDLNGTPQSTQVAYQFCDARDQVRLRRVERTNRDGLLQIELPPVEASAVDYLEVNALESRVPASIRAELRKGEAEYVTHLSLDRPRYCRGETAYYRSVTLSRFDLRADREVSVAYEVLDGNGRRALPGLRQGRTQQGVAAGSFSISPELPAGIYSFAARSPAADFAPVQQRFAVQERSPLPRKADQRLAGELYAPGSEKPARGVSVSFYPEGGDLVAGLPSRVYFYSRNALGRPIDIEGRVLDENGAVVAPVRTEHSGRGVFECTPEPSRGYRLVIDVPAGVTLQPRLPAASDEPKIVMTVQPSVLSVESQLEIDLRAMRPDVPLAVAVSCRGAMVGQQAVDPSTFTRADTGWLNRVSLPVAPEAAGVMRVTVFDYQHDPPEPVAQRLVYRRPPRKLNVHAGKLRESFSPGDKVRVELLTTDEAGQPVPALLGVGVVDGALPRIDSSYETRLPAYFYLAAELDQPENLEDANAYLSEDSETETALDLLLGTNGWRRFRRVAFDAVAQTEGFAEAPFADAAATGSERQARAAGGRKAALAYGGGGGGWDASKPERREAAPGIYNNADEVRRVVAASVPLAYDPPVVDMTQVGRVLLIGGTGLIVATMLLGLMRLSAGVRLWAPALGTAAAALLVGLLWMDEPKDRRGEVAWAPREESLKPRLSLETSHSAEQNAEKNEVSTAAIGEMIESQAPTPVPLKEEQPPAALTPSSAADAIQAKGAGGKVILGLKADVAAEEATPVPGSASRPVARGLERAAAGQRSLSVDPLPSRENGFRADADTALQRMTGRTEAEAAPPSRRGSVSRMRSKVPPEPERGGVAAQPHPTAPRPAEPAAGVAVRPEREAKEAGLMLGQSSAADRGRGSRNQLGKADLPVRQYAHVREAGDARGDFAETLYWNPMLITGEDGRATIEFDLSDVATEFRLFADGHAQGRLGAVETTIISRPAAAPNP